MAQVASAPQRARRRRAGKRPGRPCFPAIDLVSRLAQRGAKLVGPQAVGDPLPDEGQRHSVAVEHGPLGARARRRLDVALLEGTPWRRRHCRSCAQAGHQRVEYTTTWPGGFFLRGSKYQSCERVAIRVRSEAASKAQSTRARADRRRSTAAAHLCHASLQPISGGYPAAPGCTDGPVGGKAGPVRCSPHPGRTDPLYLPVPRGRSAPPGGRP